ncbi:hypothetical protein CVU82_03030 [Candidatus Falkowbacteria bacterium HGW-Falkowbacteria-1]|jgi:hypothetical protein|uniref:Uncharacterized protein n=1 Tax=Candidatus Falkowbacteria bacterium HGW-Falkowbacteria-1 TaxID=2013768 RepID=A0A2N2E9W0_9BACT|nr:MAG: hypothetical protein CVU82_03030 [Candidatus Falkowbacteria bacterium HGW-Falkowbacteria-1]
MIANKEIKGGFKGDRFVGILPKIIPESISKKFWKVSDLKKKSEVHFLPSDLSGESDDIFVVWLNGLSIAEQIEKTGGTINVYSDEPEKKDFGYRANRFWLQEKKIISEITHKKSLAGYYLVKIGSSDTKDNGWEEQNRLISDNSWRRAEANETGEILQTIFSITELRYFEKKMHISKKIGGKILAIGNFQKNRGLEVWFGSKYAFEHDTDIILIKV